MITARMILLLQVVCLLLFAGCSANLVTTSSIYPINHFQSGKTIGIDSLNGAQVGFNISTIRSISTTIVRDSVDSYREFIDDKRKIALGGSIQFALSENFDLGGDLTVALTAYDKESLVLNTLVNSEGGLALRLFGKYELLPKSSPFGVAILPVVGFVLGTQGSSEDFSLTQNDDKASASAVSKGFAFELALPLSYHFNKDLALTFTPIYYALNKSITYEFKPEGGGARESRDFSSRFTNVGFGIGIHAKFLRVEVTFIENRQGAIIPYFGLMVAF